MMMPDPVTSTALLDPAALARFALAAGVAGGQPALAHWAWFPDMAATGDLGPDGHPRPGLLLPDTGKPRRMFAAAEIRFEAPLVLGEPATFTQQVIDTRERRGASGDLVLVDVERRIVQQAMLRVREVRTLVYRDQGAPVDLPAETQAFANPWIPDEVALFRFSAATFNAHRIHYDRDYARTVEGYPDLVVHGPLIATRLAELARAHGPLAGFSFRATAPLFVNQPVALEQRGDTEFVALRCDGLVAMQATALWKTP